jgi:hypothetical protein
LIPNSLQMQEECFMVGFTMHNKENKWQKLYKRFQKDFEIQSRYFYLVQPMQQELQIARQKRFTFKGIQIDVEKKKQQWWQPTRCIC